MMKKIPEILYKYRCFDGRSISMLTNNQIYFASPLDFNDPFDCVSQEDAFFEFREESLERLARLHPDVSPAAITPQNTQQLIKALQQHPEMLRVAEEQQVNLKNFVANLGVLALSTKNDSILMWSHYANYHRGFCIGFKNNFDLAESCTIEIKYSEVRSNDATDYFLLSQTISQEEMRERLKNDFIFTKYIDWSYEKEWRIIGDKGIAIYPPNCVDRVIFGMNMPVEERNVIRHILRNRKVKFFEVVKNKRHFSLEIKLLDFINSKPLRSVE